MSITRWDPWGDMISLRDAMDRLMSESFVRTRGDEGTTNASLAVDIREEDDQFIVMAPVPGVKPDDVEITALGDTLRIRCERRERREEGGENKRWILREQRFGSFERTVRLPAAVKADQANAEFADGVLTIALPKAEHARERKIPVRSGAGQEHEIPVETSDTKGSGGQHAAAIPGP
jgi:HSP20 family protein